MNEQPAEYATSPRQQGKENRSTGDGEREEKTMLQVAEEMAIKDNICQEGQTEHKPEDQESPAKAKVKQAKVQSVFSLVRSQICAQTALDTRRTGMFQLVQRVTRQLDRNKSDQVGLVPGLEVTAVEKVTTAVEGEEETMEDKKDQETDEIGQGVEVCVVLLQEVLSSLESMRKEVREELSLLRLESQSYTEQAMKSLEARLTHTLATHTIPQDLFEPNLVGQTPGLDGKKYKHLSVPSLVATRRRTLNRTMTTIIPKSCPPPGLGPRSMSEPLGGRAAERAGSNNSRTHMFLRGGDPRGPPLLPLGPLPPALPHTQHGKKVPRNKSRICKPAT